MSNYTVLFQYGKPTKRTCHFLMDGFMILFLLYFEAFYETIIPLDMTGL